MLFNCAKAATKSITLQAFDKEDLISELVLQTLEKKKENETPFYIINFMKLRVLDWFRKTSKVPQISEEIEHPTFDNYWLVERIPEHLHYIFIALMKNGDVKSAARDCNIPLRSMYRKVDDLKRSIYA